MSIGRQILKINPNAKFSINAEDVNQITWLEGTTPISISDIEAQAGAVELEKALENLRVKRNQLLADTDYLALSDQTMTDNMKTYRQELRDLTNGLDTVEKVNAVTFPTKP
tara:strand:- start:192 stop:524 length:333 start_codon:yes stop_codon:yes gene_type:complete